MAVYSVGTDILNCWWHRFSESNLVFWTHHVSVRSAKNKRRSEQSWPAGKRGFSNGPWLHRLRNYWRVRWHYESCPDSLHSGPASCWRWAPQPISHILQTLASGFPRCDREHGLLHTYEHLGWTLFSPCPWRATQRPGLERRAVSICARWPDGASLQREGHGGGPATAEGVCGGLRGEGHLPRNTRQGWMGEHATMKMKHPLNYRKLLFIQIYTLKVKPLHTKYLARHFPMMEYMAVSWQQHIRHY